MIVKSCSMQQKGWKKMNRRTFCKSLMGLPLLTICGCGNPYKPYQQYQNDVDSTSENKPPKPPVRFLHYKPGVRLYEAMRMRDLVFTAMLAKVPRDKLVIYREELFHALMTDQGYIGVNSDYLPDGYIQEPGTGCRMAGLP